MTSKSNKSNGFRLDLGEPWANDLADFQKAHYGASATEIIRHALKAFIYTRLLEEPAMRARFDEARRQRLADR